MNCAKSVKMIVILGCIVVNLVGCGMNDTTAVSYTHLCGGYSLRAGAFLFSIEPFLKFPAQFYTRGLLDMSVGVHQHIRRGVPCGALNGFHIAAGDHQLIGGTGMSQTVEHDLFKLWMLRSPQAVPFCQQLRCDGQAIREPEQLPAVAVLFWGVLLVLLELFKPCQKLRFQRSEEHTSELQSHYSISYAVFCLKLDTDDLKQANMLINL